MKPLRKLFVLGLLVTCVVAVSSASPRVYPPWCTVPTRITLVGSRAGVPDGTGAFTVVIRDLMNNPTPSAAVVVDLSNCADLTLCSDQLDASAAVSCAGKSMRKFTDASGSATFTVQGGSNGAGQASTLAHGATLYANGVILGSPTASALDLDGVNGVGIDDLSVWLSDFGAPGGPEFGRSDFDGDGKIDINDLSLWVSAYGAGGSVQGCAASCP
jgi:hypothetical protein